jgi:hypothetical protein
MVAIRVSFGGQSLAILDRNAEYTRLNISSEAMIKSITPSPSKRVIEIRGWRPPAKRSSIELKGEEVRLDPPT